MYELTSFKTGPTYMEPEVSLHIKGNLSLNFILRQLNQEHTIIVFNIHFKIILPSIT
jgi:hypothetical protein